MRMTVLIVACIGGCKAAEPAALEPVPFESTDEPTGLVPLKAFASLPLVRTMELSPSGTYLASIQNVGSKTYLVTTTHDGKDLRRLFECNNVAYFLNWFQWINDDRLLIGVYVVDVKIGGMSDLKWIQTRVLAINRDGTDLQTDLIPPDFDGRAFRYGDTPQIQDSVIGTIPGDDRAVLIALDLKSSTYPDVFKLNVYTGERELVERNIYGIRDWTADRQGVIRLGTAVDGTIIHHLVKPPGSDEWRTLSKFDVTRETGMTPLGFDEDPNILFVRQPLEGRAAVYRLDLSKPASPPQLLASHPVYDVEGDMIYAPWLKHVVGTHYRTDGREIVYWDPAAKELQTRIDLALPRRANTIYSSSKDGRRHVLASGHSTQPTQWYLLDEQSNRLHWIADNYPNLDPKTLVQPVPMTFKARDGTVLHGYLTRPPQSPQARPLIVLPHGGPVHRDTMAFDDWVQFLVSRGWAVLQVNFRGSRGYGTKFTEAGFKRWGLEMQDDLTDGVQFAVERGVADPKRICIVGGSYGGYAALMGIIKTPDLYRCAVSFAGVSDLPSLLAEKRNFVNYQIGWERQLGSAWSDRNRLKETSPITHADDIRTPLLLVHGVQDRVVMIEQSREMAEALKKAGNQTYRYVELPEADHHLSRAEDRITFFRELERFLRTHLDGSSTALPREHH